MVQQQVQLHRELRCKPSGRLSKLQAESGGEAKGCLASSQDSQCRDPRCTEAKLADLR